MVVGVKPVIAKVKADDSSVAPSSSTLARGTSVDGYWSDDAYSWNGWITNGCNFCTGDPSCQCFYSDSTNGSGIFQVNINQYTTMIWSQELDYSTYGLTTSGSLWNACYPASGEGEIDDIGGSAANTLTYATTGQLCVTPDGQNQTYTGSYIIDGGTGLYPDYQGAGTIGDAIYGRLPSEVVSQIQFNGNIVPPAPSPSPLPTPSPWAAVATPTP
ncbi:MAG TPA: hypothetical protein VMF50_04760 [Candidatus Binataceae bacterium]|nr:hypothetical protein [Candidatus Binataceae bacterium]